MIASTLQKYQVVTFLCAWLSYAVTYFLRKPLGVIKPLLESDLKLSKTALGWLDVALLGPYSVAQVTTSRIGDRLGPRVTITLCLCLAGTAMFTFGFWDSYFVLFILMVLNGAAQGNCIVLFMYRASLNKVIFRQVHAGQRAVKFFVPGFLMLESIQSLVSLQLRRMLVGHVGSLPLDLKLKKDASMFFSCSWNRVCRLHSVYLRMANGEFFSKS